MYMHLVLTRSRLFCNSMMAPIWLLMALSSCMASNMPPLHARDVDLLSMITDLLPASTTQVKKKCKNKLPTEFNVTAAHVGWLWRDQQFLTSWCWQWARHVPTLAVSYESVARHTNSTMNKVQEFLGVTPMVSDMMAWLPESISVYI